MFYLLKKHLVYKDSYFLYKEYSTKDALMDDLKSFDNPKSYKIIYGHELFCRYNYELRGADNEECKIQDDEN